ncbi:MAG: hypothetical protein ABI702_07330 [Burkholderiales bacterium]
MKRLVQLAAWFMLACSPASHALDLIAHESVTLDIDEVRNTFLGEKLLLGTLKLVPVDNAALQDEFLAKVLQTDSKKYYARWSRKVYREGLVIPPSKGTDAEVMAFVRATPGAIGYVTKAAAGVKVLRSY